MLLAKDSSSARYLLFTIPANFALFSYPIRDSLLDVAPLGALLLTLDCEPTARPTPR